MHNQEQVLAIIRATRSLSFPAWGNISATHKNGNPHDVVTDLDKRIEFVLREELSQIDPVVPFVGEETGGDRSADIFWLVDPIDGTGHFVRGLPFCTTMVARIEQGKVRFAAIYDFVHDVMYHAEAGKGAFADSTHISVSTRSASEAKISYESKLEERDNLEKYGEVCKTMRPMQLLCSGYEHILVATGKIEGRVGYYPYGFDYDYAPGCLLVQEAGGIVANIGSGTYDYRDTNYIAANSAVYDALVHKEDAPFKQGNSTICA